MIRRSVSDERASLSGIAFEIMSATCQAHAKEQRETSRKLVIAAPSFCIPSETFIRDHIRTLTPGGTILLCEDRKGANQFGCPVLAPIRTWRGSKKPVDRLVNAARQRWQLYVDSGILAADRRRLHAFFAAYHPVAVLAEYGPTGCWLARTCREAGVPLYVHFHGYDANILPRRFAIRRQYRRLFLQAEKVIAASQFMKARLVDLGCDPDRVAVVPCGVDSELFRPSSSPARDGLILMVHRLTPQKGPLLSLRSFSKVAKRNPHIRLEIIGEGPLKGELEDEVRKLDIADRVCLHGARSHEFVRARLEAAQFLIQHCVSLPGQGIESLGLSILEAMACGLPVVATRHGAITETVKHGVTGLLVAERDIDRMADAMTQLLSDPIRAAAMGAAGRQRVLDRFTLNQSRDQLRVIMGLPAASPKMTMSG